MLKKIRTFFRIGWFKSIYLNFRILPFMQAIKLPIIVSRKTTLESLTGSVHFKTNPSFGMMKFGFNHSDLFSWRAKYTIIKIEGNVYAGDFAQFGVGCSLIVDEGANLYLGDNFSIGGFSKIICRKKIAIGDNFRGAWDVQVFDTNFHYIKNVEDGSVTRREYEVVLGANNWMGNRASVMPGTKTNDFFIAASNSLCNKDYTASIPKYSLVAGSPAKLLKTNVVCVLDREEKEITSIFNESVDNVLYVNPKPRPRY